MATPPQQSQPSNPSGPQSSRDLAQSIKKLIEDQGDYNNLLKDALKDANKMDGVYKRIQARIESMTRDTINTKRLNSELYALRQKEVIAKKNAADLEKELSDNTKRDLKQRETLNSLLKNTSDTQTKLRIMKQMQVMDSKLEANLELKALEIAKQGVKIAGEEIKMGEKAVENEKKVSKQMGISGNLMKMFADKLGVGEEAYSAMTLAARETVDATGKVTNPGKWKVLGAGIKSIAKTMWSNLGDPAVITATLVAGFSKAKKMVGGLIGGAAGALTGGMKSLAPEGSTVVSGLTSGISSMAKNIPFIGGALSGIIDGFSALLDLVIGIDHAIVKAGRNLGMTGAQARQLNRHFQDISLSQGNVFVTSKKLLESYVEIANQLEINNRISDEALQTNIMLKDFAGLELDTRAKIVEVGKITGKSSEGLVKTVLAQVKGLEKATGVQFNYQKILKEVTSLSGVLGLRLSKYPAELTKSYMTIKAMGMDMKQLDSMADSFLDFESSISKEFEAQLLTGKSINLNKARELFLNNDLAGAAMEINKQVGSSGDFLKMNRIQAEAIAQAMGMSRDQMGDMLQKQELYSSLGAKGTENAREMYQLALKKYGTEKEMAAAMGDQAYQSMVQASTQEKLMAFIEKIKQSVMDFVERSGIIEKIEGLVNNLTNPNTIKGIIKWVRDAIAGAIEMVSGLVGDLFEVVADLPFTDEKKWMQRAQFFKEGGMSMANRVRSVGGDFGGTGVNQTQAAANAVPQYQVLGTSQAGGNPAYVSVELMVDGQKMTKVVKKVDLQDPSGKYDYNRLFKN